MSAVPKHRASHMRQGRRRSVIKAAVQTLTVCLSCGKPKLPHRACPACGVYHAITAKA